MTPQDALAAALHDSDFMRRYAYYADKLPTMQREPEGTLAAQWSAQVLAALPAGWRLTDERLREAKENVVRLTRLLEKCERQRAFLRSASEEETDGR